MRAATTSSLTALLVPLAVALGELRALLRREDVGGITEGPRDHSRRVLGELQLTGAKRLERGAIDGGLGQKRDRLMPGASTPAPAASAKPASSGGPTASLFTARVLGNPPRGEERPQIAHVAISDLDRDGLNDVLVCDSFRNIVTWIRQAPRGTFTETTIAGVAAPAHVEAVDFDKDGDLDLVVAALGFLFPNNNRVGSVIVLENDGDAVPLEGLWQRIGTAVSALGWVDRTG